MKLAAYTSWSCTYCKAHERVFGRPRQALYTSLWVRNWVRDRAETSSYIRDRAKGCRGCAEVYEDRVRVLVNALALLGIKVDI